MKIQKNFVADNQNFGWDEIESMITSYEMRSSVDSILNSNPTAKIKVTYNLEIEID